MPIATNPMKKGFTWLEWVLATGIVVAITAFTISWSMRETKSLTEDVVYSLAGHSDCREVKLSATADCVSTVTITNRGRFKIKKLILTLDTQTQMDTEKEGLPELNLPGTGMETISLNTLPPFSNMTAMPLIEVEGKLFGCSEKALVVRC